MSNGGGSISQKRHNACSKLRDSCREITSLTLRRGPGGRGKMRADQGGTGGAIVATYARGASSHGPDPFALSDPRVFERELTEAGFDEVITRALPFESHYASLDAFLQSTASRLTAGVMGQLRKPEQQHLLGEVRQALSQFEGSHGLVASAELLLGVGSK